MPIYAFERLVYPARVGSPFLGKSAVKGPGGIGEPVEKAEGEKIEGGGTGRKRARRNPASEATTSSSSPAVHMNSLNPNSHTTVGRAPAGGSATTVSADTKDRTMLTAAGNLSVPPIVDKLPPETSTLCPIPEILSLMWLTARFFDRSPETNELLWFAAPPLNVARQPAPKHSLAYLHFLAKKRQERMLLGSSDSMDIDDDARGKSDASNGTANSDER